MIEPYNLKESNVLVLGYALTGKSVAEFLLNKGATVTINDRGDLSSDPSVRLLLERGVKIVDKEHPVALLDEEFDFIVKNPGIPYSIDILKEAKKRKIPIYTDVELAYWYSKAPIVGITGSNGKSTTTSLIHKLLENRKEGHSLLAGNIGVPSLDVVTQATSLDDIVMELSSFQLMGTEYFKPEIAVICNIFSAHLDYHGTREEYIKAKLRLIRNLTSDNYLVYNYDQGELSQLVQDNPSIKIPFAHQNVTDFVKKHGVYLKNNTIFYKDEMILDISSIQIPGIHNIENVMAAIAVAKIKDISNKDIIETIQKYQGMSHRIQLVANSSNRKFFNDSKATNITATITALKSFTEPIIYIGGGLDRGNMFDELIPYLSQIKAAYLYGESKDKMYEAFKKANIPVVKLVDSLVEATTSAYHTAQEGDIVLFSPSCASWDQFKNFEIRGDVYVETVQQLIKTEPYLN